MRERERERESEKATSEDKERGKTGQCISGGDGGGSDDGDGDGGGGVGQPSWTPEQIEQTEEKRATTLLHVFRELRHIYRKLRHCHRRHCRFVGILRIPSKSINRSPVPENFCRSTACLRKCVMLDHVSARQRYDGNILLPYDLLRIVMRLRSKFQRKTYFL